MKTSLAVAVGTVFLLAAGMPFAQDTKAPASSHDDHAAQSVSSANTGGQMSQMDEHMKKMRALHEHMASATTPEERQKAMEEQRKEMQAGVGMMNQMGSMGSGMTAEKGKPADQKAQMQMMQKRMDMMQMMMQMMLDQQGMMAPPKAGDAASKK